MLTSDVSLAALLAAAIGVEVGENYVGYEKTEKFASPGGAGRDRSRAYTDAARLRLGQWALSGDSTDGGRRPAAGLAFISALTAALPAMTKVLALEVAPVRVNLIAAGFVGTPLSAAILGDQLDAPREQLRKVPPIGRVVGPDIAALAIHLMTNTAVTGATLDSDGGQQLVEG